MKMHDIVLTIYFYNITKTDGTSHCIESETNNACISLNIHQSKNVFNKNCTS